MTVELELQIASNTQTLPHPAQFKEWISAVLSDRIDAVALTIRIVDAEESADLNFKYRKKLGATNVLSFPAEALPDEIEAQFNWSLLGDIVICAPLVAAQAKQYHKKLIAHWAHLVIHGTLHLLGYDHQNSEEAGIMENIEITIMRQLGYDNPYKKHKKINE